MAAQNVWCDSCYSYQYESTVSQYIYTTRVLTAFIEKLEALRAGIAGSQICDIFYLYQEEMSRMGGRGVHERDKRDLKNVTKKNIYIYIYMSERTGPRRSPIDVTCTYTKVLAVLVRA